MSNIKLIHGDCMDVMREYPDKYFDLAVVDPPYGIGIGKNKSGMGRRKGDAKAKYKMGDWDENAPDDSYFFELFRVSKNQIIWGANHFISKIPLDSPCWLQWDKMFSNDVTFAAFELAWTSFETTCKKFTKHPVQDNRIHPTQKPIELYSWILKSYSSPNMKILDTHLGSASSAIAAHQFGINEFIGVELDRDYYDAAMKRFKQVTAQVSIFDVIRELS